MDVTTAQPFGPKRGHAGATEDCAADRTNTGGAPGCLLVSAGEEGQAKVVDRTGRRDPMPINEEEALKFARAAAEDFGVGAAWTANFDRASVTKSAEKKQEQKAAKSKKAK